MIVLTGATGFVGRHVLKRLTGDGVPVRILVRDGHQLALDDVGSLVEVTITQDLFAESEERLTDALGGSDTIIHAAWYAEPGKYLDSPRNYDCLLGTIRLAKCFAAAGGRRFVGVGSCFEYDSSPGRLGIETPLAPRTAYAASKAATYSALSYVMPTMNVQFVWARLFYLYGEGEDSRRLVPYLRRQLSNGEPAELTNGTQVRDFLEIREAARQLVEAAMSQRTGPVNICSELPVTVRELAERIADEYGRRDLLRFGARAENAFDPPVIVGIK